MRGVPAGLTEYKSLPELDESIVKRYLCYPKFDEETFRERVSQLEILHTVSSGTPFSARDMSGWF